MRKKTFFYLFVDILLITVVFLVFIWIKPASKRIYLPEYTPPFLFFLIIWVAVSVAIDKYRLHKKETLNDLLFPVFVGDFIILATILTLIYVFQQFEYSRLIVFGTFFVSFSAELALVYAYYHNRKLRHDAEYFDQVEQRTMSRLASHDVMMKTDYIFKIKAEAPIPPLNKDLVISEAGIGAYEFIKDQINIDQVYTLLVATTTRFNIDNQPKDYFQAIVNLARINNINRINKFFESVNEKLPIGGIFIGCSMINITQKQLILKRYPVILNYLIYFFYFFFKRVMPKIPIGKKVYFFFTRGRNRALSRAETLGRLYSCGFEVLDEQMINNLLYFSARKIQKPAFDYNPTYGPFVRLKRIGKNGKIIYVYKFRTMHPYSEYIQHYVYEKQALEEGGKFKDDFRVTTLGRIMRKLWIDELPMLINLFRGDLKIVGIRPLSSHYFNLYDEELKAKRIRTRPGLIPPFYADMPKTLEEIQQSEHRYLDAHFKSPFLTDCKYFWKALYNIVVKHARSR